MKFRKLRITQTDSSGSANSVDCSSSLVQGPTQSTGGLLNALWYFHGVSTLGAVGGSLSRGLHEGLAVALLEAILSGGLHKGSEFVTPVIMRGRVGLPTNRKERSLGRH